MVIYIGSDHRGFELKQFIKDVVKSEGYELYDLGNALYNEGDDYPEFAAAVAKKIILDPEGTRGIIICGSGVGVDIVANKFPGIRAGLAISSDQIYQARRDDNLNILCISSDFTPRPETQKIVELFLKTAFSGEERHARRIQKITEIENQLIPPRY